MPRYIDADKTLDLMWNALYQYEDDDEKKNGLSTTRLDVQNGFEIAHKVVVDAPAEDVAPVAHAHWIVKKETDCYGDHYRTYIICSKCNHLTFKRWNYCPDCGAKMDEEVS